MLIRAAAVVLAFLGGIGLTVYVVLWLLLPDRRGDILAERAVRQGDAGPIALLVLAAFLVLGGLFSIGNGNGWFAPLWLIPVAAIAWFVLARRGTGTPQSGYGAPPAGVPQQPPGHAASRHPATSPHPRPRQETAMSDPHPDARRMPAPARPRTAAPSPAPTAVRRCPASRDSRASPARTAAGPPRRRPRARSAPRRPRGRGVAGPARSSAWCRSASPSSGIGLGAALDDPLGFPGSSATLGFLIALTGVSVVVLALGIKGRASGFSGFLVVVLALMLVAASAASRVEIQDGVGDRTWAPCPPPDPRPSSSVPVTPPST